MEYTLALTDQAEESTRQAILEPLIEYNDSQVGPSQGQPLVITVNDNGGKIVGGLWGYTAYGWLFTQLLAVPANARGKGLGTRLMTAAESEAIARGCKGAWLDTFEFQARKFYERIGYQCFAELPDFPPGYSRFFLRKALAATSSEAPRSTGPGRQAP